jgi:hypothetical protein
MAEEHPKHGLSHDGKNKKQATLTWRKTTWRYETLYTLTGWENVLTKEDLPFEYTDRGPHFWEVGNKIHISNNRPKSDYADLADRWVVPELYLGQSLLEYDFEKLIPHLRKACEWLRRVKQKVSESEEIVVELEPLPDPVPPPDPEPYDPSVAFDDGAVIDKKPTLLERAERILHGWNTEESKEG